MTLKTATRFRGDTIPFTRTLATATGSAFDLTGATVALSLSTQRTGGTILGPVTGTINNATGGVVSFSLTALNLAVGTYYWDVQVTNATGIETVEVGVLTVDQDLTV